MFDDPDINAIALKSTRIELAARILIAQRPSIARITADEMQEMTRTVRKQIGNPSTQNPPRSPPVRQSLHRAMSRCDREPCRQPTTNNQ
ncbi:MAG: hypothetical protein AAGA60_29210 [Cyanobacteria bacterium P01_E01_bin.42]